MGHAFKIKGLRIGRFGFQVSGFKLEEGGSQKGRGVEEVLRFCIFRILGAFDLFDP